MKTFWLQKYFFIIFIFVIVFPENYSPVIMVIATAPKHQILVLNQNRDSKPTKEVKDVTTKISAVDAKVQNNIKLGPYNKKTGKAKKRTYKTKKYINKARLNKNLSFTEELKNDKQVKIKSIQRMLLATHKKKLSEKGMQENSPSLFSSLKKKLKDSDEVVKKDENEGKKTDNISGKENDTDEKDKSGHLEDNTDVEELKKLHADQKNDVTSNEESHEHKIEGLSAAATMEPGFDLTPEEMKKFNIWPNGLIPYYVDDFSFDQSLSKKIDQILENINSRSGLKFSFNMRAPEKDQRWVLFINRKGALDCEDYNHKSFTNEGVQKVVVGYDCLETPTWLSSVALALAGVPPQHNSPDRDKYITVSLENVIPEKKDKFVALKNDEWLFHDVPYDYQSASHYDSHKYSHNGSATIVPKGGVAAIPDENQEGLSFTDVEKLRMLYNFIAANQDSVKIGCNKLFRPGPGKFTPRNIAPKPRKKPSKYTGVADPDEKHLEEDKTAEKDEHSNKPPKKDEEAHSKHLENSNQHTAENDQKIGEIKDIKGPKDFNDDDDDSGDERKTSVRPLKLKKKIDIAKLEDFNTSE